jgi:hypothetical protein
VTSPGDPGRAARTEQPLGPGVPAVRVPGGPGKHAGPAGISRREFLERAALAGAGLGLAPALDGWPFGPAAARRGGPNGTGAGRRQAVARQLGGELMLAGDGIAVTWAVNAGVLHAVRLEDRLNGKRLTLPADVFVLALAGGGTIRSTDLRVLGAPRMETVAANAGASRGAARIAGRRIVVALEDREGRLRATWRAEVRDGSRYVRHEVELEALRGDVAVRQITLLDVQAAGAAVYGTVAGSPVVAGNLFMALEHPLSDVYVEGDRVRCVLRRQLPLRLGAPARYSAVIGVVPSGQLRRGFLEYIERERAHPYRTFLHYNSWYDLGYFTPYDEAGALDRIHAFGEALHVKRGVALDSFLFDDGWDDHRSLWRFNSGFPHGFTRVHEAAARYGAAPGVWLSPWGGYGEPRKERLEHGRKQGFETNHDGFALSGPHYYARFEAVCLDMIRHYGVNQFKIDGTGNAAYAAAGSSFDSDFDAAIHLIERLRQAEPDLYVNLTTGTYPSPFWLRWADSTWRGGDDHAFAGVGSQRQQWITYRDAATYAGVVKKGPLYPLNALMLHGLIYAQHAKGLSDDPGHDFRDEVHAYFGNGTQLQEMYITPSLLSADDWDAISEAARWSRRNAGTLVDTHWVGGDPDALEPYGWAAWSRVRGILTLRNPKDSPQALELDIGKAFELPPGVAGTYTATSPWRGAAPTPPLALRAGEPHAFRLAPFEVLTLEAVAHG